ncbi:MAG: hypothetical protein ACREQF_08590, partial [Candidatus Binataceae bacterium]
STLPRCSRRSGSERRNSSSFAQPESSSARPLVIAMRLAGPFVATFAACILHASNSSAQYLSPAGFDADLITPAGIHVKTNGQYKTEETRRAAATAIDRYWDAVRRCALTVIPPTDTLIRGRLLDQFPPHLSIEIASDWQIVEGRVSRRRMQAFASLERPGAFSTARREEHALYIKVVPELNGLGPQMAGEVNLWLGGNTNALPTELSQVCAPIIPCVRFAYDNAPSQAWEKCEP